MKREIKFRAWDIKNKKFIEIAQIHTSIDNHTIAGITESWTGRKLLISEIEWVQFTGLHDKNGKEIYEGDVLKVWNPNGEECDNLIVEWNIYACTFPIEGDFGDFDVTTIGWAMQLEYTFEIIGNIYENPELL